MKRNVIQETRTVTIEARKLMRDSIVRQIIIGIGSGLDAQVGIARLAMHGHNPSANELTEAIRLLRIRCRRHVDYLLSKNARERNDAFFQKKMGVMYKKWKAS